jgi:hypothetical protein
MHGHEGHTDQQRHAAFAGGPSLHAEKLTQGDSKFSHHEAEHDDADAGANPSQKGPLVRKMVRRFSELLGRR